MENPYTRKPSNDKMESNSAEPDHDKLALNVYSEVVGRGTDVPNYLNLPESYATHACDHCNDYTCSPITK